MKSHLPAGGDPRESPSPACSAVASPTAALATRRDISVRSRFPQGGRTSSRCRDPLWDATVFCRDSFDREDPVRHESALSLALQRPLTSCALRLRKPRLTSRSLTSSVVRRRSRGGSTIAAFAPVLSSRRTRESRLTRPSSPPPCLRAARVQDQDAFHRLGSSISQSRKAITRGL
jgi:hypothetical protein